MVDIVTLNYLSGVWKVEERFHVEHAACGPEKLERTRDSLSPCSCAFMHTRSREEYISVEQKKQTEQSGCCTASRTRLELY